MGRPRSFDHDEARRLRADGMPARAIGERLGVSHTSVYRALYPNHPSYSAEKARVYLYSATCPDCGGERNRYRARCQGCAAKAQTKVADGRAYCPACSTWKPLADFSPSKWRATRGVHGECRACDSARRRAYRARHRVADDAYQREYKRRKRASA